jgi:hypothetical protein
MTAGRKKANHRCSNWYVSPDEAVCSGESLFDKDFGDRLRNTSRL